MTCLCGSALEPTGEPVICPTCLGVFVVGQVHDWWGLYVYVYVPA